MENRARNISFPFKRSISVFRDKVIMITGNLVSFDNAVLGRFLRSDLGGICIFSRYEKRQN